ncbi:MAG: hypothetical protein U9R48_04860 [Chloroflexota bacterium]|nr:hypothetical protein [Chloroflexota bacterium]
MTEMLWGLLALAAVAIAWWAARVDWAALRDSYRTLPNQIGQVLSFLMIIGALLVLRGIALLPIARDAAISSITAGWLLTAVVVILVLRWPRY